MNLACASRYLEEPVLSTLWEKQFSLCTLLRVLPGDTWEYLPEYVVRDLGLWLGKPNAYIFGSFQLSIVGDPSPEAWKRPWRYGFWMRALHPDQWGALEEDTIRKLRLNSPAGGLFPALRDCHWRITKCNLPHADLFLSHNFEGIHISVPADLREILPTIASVISKLPTHTLQRLDIDTSLYGVYRTYLKDSLSSVVLRCGPSLTEFTSPTPLSDAAVDHLIHLPHLNTWRVEGPPIYSAPPFPLKFPPLVRFVLGGGVGPGWLSLLKRWETHVSLTRGTTPLSKAKESLKYLTINCGASIIIDVPLVSSIQMFRNLVTLDIPDFYDDGWGQCTFKLDNDCVTELAMALPQLER